MRLEIEPGTGAARWGLPFASSCWRGQLSSAALRSTNLSAGASRGSLKVSRLAMEAYPESRAIRKSDDLYELALQVLGAHDISYSDTRTNGESISSPFRMQNGQLMGSPLSFPILTLCNKHRGLSIGLEALYPRERRDWTGDFGRKGLPVRANGYDILFKANLEFTTTSGRLRSRRLASP